MTDDTQSRRFTNHHRVLARVRLPLLDDLRDYDENAADAMVLRRTGFHEAGHLWAAHNAGLNVAYSEADGSRCLALRDLKTQTRAFVGAAGVLAAAVLEDSDYNCEPNEALNPHTVDWEPVLTAATGYGCGDVAVCGEAACTWAGGRSTDADIVDVALKHIVEDWHAICEVAAMLIVGTPVSSLEIGW